MCKQNGQKCLQIVNWSFRKILLQLGDSKARNRGNNAAFWGVDEKPWEFWVEFVDFLVVFVGVFTRKAHGKWAKIGRK